MPTVVRRKQDMVADICKFRGQGFAFTATAGTTSDHDYKLLAARLIESPILICKGHAWGDYIRFQVVDVDNILGMGAGTVLDEFATTWYLDDSIQTQLAVDLWYSAEIIANLYVRIKFTSVGGSNVDVKVNFCNHAYSA